MMFQLYLKQYFLRSIFSKKNFQLQDNQIHVKFLHDNGRRSWINLKNRILPFKGLTDYERRCEVNGEIFQNNFLILIIILTLIKYLLIEFHTYIACRQIK